MVYQHFLIFTPKCPMSARLQNGNAQAKDGEAESQLVEEEIDRLKGQLELERLAVLDLLGGDDEV